MSRKRPRIELGPELGRGATAVVHRARLAEPWAGWASGTWVALKRLLPECAQDPELRAALTREAAALGRAQHPGLQRLVFHEQEGPQGPELLSALIEGPGLDQELDAHGPLEEERVRALGTQLAGALAALHANGLAHGDLKPENVRLDGEGRAVLVDLGFARDLADEAAPESGSVAYLSPERARGAAPSAAADVYALGTSLWQLAADAHPLLEAQHALTGGPEALFARLSSGPAPILSSRAPLASPFLDAALAHALQPEPELRPSAALS